MNRARTAARELGASNATFYLIGRALERLGAPAGLHRYLLIAQPVKLAPMLPARRGRNLEVREVTPSDPALAAMPRPLESIIHRCSQGSVCLGAFRAGELIGYLWLTLGPYSDEDVRCRFVPQPAGKGSFDHDIFILPKFRTGLAFARLWDAANAYLRERGIAWSFSWISAFNPASMAAHRRLGAQQIGTVTYLRVGRWQMMVSGLPPYVHVSSGPHAVPDMPLHPPADS